MHWYGVDNSFPLEEQMYWFRLLGIAARKDIMSTYRFKSYKVFTKRPSSNVRELLKGLYCHVIDTLKAIVRVWK